jgi:hypothetical protein
MVSQRSNNGGLVGGGILIGLGLLFLLGQFVTWAAWTNLWPLMIIGVGAVFFVGMVAGGKSAAPLAIPGAIIGTIGLLLLFQNITGHWETWSYGWTMIITAVGLGIFIAGVWSDTAQQRRAGLRVAGIGFILFVLFGAFFEIVLTGWGGSRLQQTVFPALLILLGLFLIFRRSSWWPGSTLTNPNSIQNPRGVEPKPQPPERPQS